MNQIGNLCAAVVLGAIVLIAGGLLMAPYLYLCLVVLGPFYVPVLILMGLDKLINREKSDR